MLATIACLGGNRLVTGICLVKTCLVTGNLAGNQGVGLASDDKQVQLDEWSILWARIIESTACLQR
jgi:hypothetical protein